MKYKRLPSKLNDKYAGVKVIKDLGMDSTKHRRAIFECNNCGSEFETRVTNVRSMQTTGCGCSQKKAVSISNTKHGDSKKDNKYYPIYRAYNNIKYRCYNKKAKYYPIYGGAGVTMCEEWLDSYDAFKKWSLLNGWERGLEIDKDIINKEAKVYSPSTCCWVTHATNAKHKDFKLGKHGYRYVSVDKRKYSKGQKSFFGQKTVGDNRITTPYFRTPNEAFIAIQNKILEIEEK